MVQRCFLATWNRGGLISSAVAIATAKALILRNPQLNLSHIDCDCSLWAKSLFHRMGLVKSRSLTSKLEIPEVGRQEAELFYQYEIVTLVEKRSILSRLLINLDQTTLTHMLAACQMLVQVSRITFFECKSKTL